jgi:hypothetical protein
VKGRVKGPDWWRGMTPLGKTLYVLIWAVAIGLAVWAAT